MTRWLTEKLNCHRALNMDPWCDYAPEVWEGRLAECAKHWEDQFINATNTITARGKGYSMMQNIPEIDRIIHDSKLLDSDNRDARVLVESLAQKLLRDCVTTPDGVRHIFRESASDLVATLDWNELDPERILSCINGVEEPPEHPFPINITQAAASLLVLNADTPVQLLNSLLRNEDLQINQMPLKENDGLEVFSDAFTKCESRISKVNKNNFPTKDLYVDALRHIKTMLRRNPSDLDSVKRYMAAARAMGPIMQRIVDEKGYNLGSTYLDELLDKGLALSDDRELVIRLIACECYTLRIPIDMTSDDVDTIRCPECGTLITNRAMPTCLVCNIPLRNICPRCSAGSDIDSDCCPKCKYPFNIEDVVLESYCDNFNDQTSKGHTESARNVLNLFRSTYPYYRNLGLMEKTLDDLEFLARFNLEEAENLYHSGRYYSALGKFDVFKTSFPELYGRSFNTMSDHKDCECRVRDAEVLYMKASNSMGSLHLTLLKDASMRCPDHPQVLEALSGHTPLAPKGATSRSATGGIVIEYDCDDESVTSFNIIRVDPSTGEVTDLGEVMDRRYLDFEAPVGVPCRYRVYSNRGSIKSASYSMTLEAMALGEVTDVTARVDELGVHLGFQRPANSTRTLITRTSDIDDEPVEFMTNGNGFHDSTVQDGAHYRYHLTSEFELYGEPIFTPGVDVCATSLSHPAPVRDLEVRRLADGQYVARWDCEDDVVLYMDGDINGKPLGTVDVSRFDATMRRIDPTRLYENGMRFAVDIIGQVSIVPVSLKGGFGREGVRVLLTEVEPFRNIRAHLMNESCLLTMEWPSGARWAEIKVVYDDGPRDPVLVTRESYVNSNGAHIALSGKGLVYFHIRAVYESSGTRLHSDVTTIRVNSGGRKILTYTVDRDHRGSTVVLNVPSGLDAVPSLLATTRVNGMPLSSDDGSIVWQSHGPIDVRNGIVSIRMDGIDFGPNTRLFFKDKGEYDCLSIIHPLARGDRQ